VKGRIAHGATTLAAEQALADSEAVEAQIQECAVDLHQVTLSLFVDHPLVPMDNNIAERAHRTPVVGRKNFYGSGSLWSGQLAAAMYTVLTFMMRGSAPHHGTFPR